MTARQRPRINKAARSDQTQDSVVEVVRQKMLSRLPEMIDVAIEESLAGNTATLNKMIDFARELMVDAEQRRGNDVLDKISNLRSARVEDINAGERGHPTDLGTTGRDGPEHPDASREASDVVGTDDPPSADF